MEAYYVNLTYALAYLVEDFKEIPASNTVHAKDRKLHKAVSVILLLIEVFFIPIYLYVTNQLQDYSIAADLDAVLSLLVARRSPSIGKKKYSKYYVDALYELMGSRNK